MKQKYKAGFTIVELLIVVIVIAILATITIVSFNNISNRAKASAAQASAKQAYTKTLAYAVENSDTYPASLAAIGISDGNGTTYQYSVNNNSSPRSFCITATSNSKSSFTSNGQAAPQPGACPGHGADGGTVITNLARSPQYTAGWSGLANPSNSGGQSSNSSVPQTGGPANGPFLRRTYIAASGALGSGDIYTLNGPNVTVGQKFRTSVFVRSNRAQSVRLQVQWINATNGSAGTQENPSVTLVPNAWTRLTNTVEAQAPTGTVSIRVDIDGGTNSIPWANGDTIDATMLMITEGSDISAFADGSSPGWAWNGDAGNSTSTGPAL